MCVYDSYHSHTHLSLLVVVQKGVAVLVVNVIVAVAYLGRWHVQRGVHGALPVVVMGCIDWCGVTLKVFVGKLIDLLLQLCRRVQLAELVRIGWVHRLWKIVLHMWIHMMPNTRSRVGTTEVSWIGVLRHLKLR